MKKILGIIAEYNPFHNGHLYHFTKATKKIMPDYTICIMSGNFVQRGEPALMDKWTRAEIAIKNGFDLVVELPTIYSISSAENFARGAIALLKSMGANYVSFGSECDNIDSLATISQFLINEPSDFKEKLQNKIKSGKSFAISRAETISEYFNSNNKTNNSLTSNEVLEILKNSNNILSIEYLKQINIQHAKISKHLVKRKGAKYSSLDINAQIPSATAIRNIIFSEDFNQIENYIPNSCYSEIKKKFENNNLVNLKKFEKEIFYKLTTMNYDELLTLPDVDENLARKIIQSISISNTLKELIFNIKSKYYTITRIQRVLIYVLLGITKQDMELSKNTIPYCKILAVNSDKKEIFSVLKQINPNLNLLFASNNKLENNINNRLLDIDILATKIYSLSLNEKSIFFKDFTNKL